MIHRSMPRYVFAFLTLLLLIPSVARGQTGTTSVRGVVLDKSGAAIVGARITIANPAQALQRSTRSNSAGEYEFLALPPGTYTLTAEKDGFRKYEKVGLELLVNVAVSVTVKLEVGSVTDAQPVAQAVSARVDVRVSWQARRRGSQTAAPRPSASDRSGASTLPVRAARR